MSSFPESKTVKSSFFPESFITRIKEAVNLVNVVSEVVALRKTGRNYQGLCPFHSEKTPSFMVNEEKQIFRCFGCGLGGNVFTFLMQYHHWSFPETVAELAQRSGIPLPKTAGPHPASEGPQQKEALRAVQALAADFYHQLLLNGKKGRKGQDYLAYRKMDQTIAEEFLLGYAPEGWDHLTNFLRKKQIPLPVLEQSGLVIKKEQGGYYDRFRNRLIFPIFDDRGRAIGFGGRAMGNEAPKYLNSPESPIFNKGQILYGLSKASATIRSSNQVVVVEGYFDLLSLHLHGLKQTVAPLGTALGSSQIRKLKGLAEDLILLFDGDPPGIQAAMRSIAIFQQEKVTARIKVLPAESDPDSYIWQVGAERFSRELQQAEPMMTFFFNRQIGDAGSQVQDQARMIDRLVPHLKALTSEWERAYYVGMVSQKLRIPESVVWKSMKETAPAHKRPGGTAKSLQEGVVPGLEWHIIEALLKIPQAAPLLLEKDLTELLESGAAKALYRKIAALYAQHGAVDPSLLLNEIEEQDLKNQIAFLTFRGLPEDKDETPFLSDLMKRIRLKELQHQEKALYREIRSKEKSGVTEDLRSLLALKKDLLQRRKEILLSSKG
jgi:DNA primase